MAIAKLLLFFVGVVIQQYGFAPPNVRPPTEKLREQRGTERAFPFVYATLGRVCRTPEVAVHRCCYGPERSSKAQSSLH